MFQRDTRKTTLTAAFAMSQLVFHAAVRSIRKGHGNAVIGLLLNILQTVMLIAVFYMLMNFLSVRGTPVRGDPILYVMSGIFVFMTHTKALGAVASSDGPTSAMMKHAPMNVMVSVASAALAALYLQFLSAGIVLFFYHAMIQPISIHEPVQVMGMMLLAWALGVAMGMVAQAARPWWPEGVAIFVQLYQRASMIFSGKMFLANSLPGFMLPYFDWHPLFHIIDQIRGFIFLNYNPHYSEIAYPVECTLVFLMIGLMAEFYTRKHASASWGAGK